MTRPTPGPKRRNTTPLSEARPRRDSLRATDGPARTDASTTGRSGGAPRCFVSAEQEATCDIGTCNTSNIPSNEIENQPADGDLRRLIDAWPALPDALRAGIVAMVEAAAKSDGEA